MKYEVNDFHIHTRYSGCCTDKENTTIRNVVARADKLGYECIGITDHVFSIRDKEVIEKVKADVDEVKNDFKVKVLVSAEVDMMPSGEILIDGEYASTLDYVLVAANHFHLIGQDNPSHYSPRQAADKLLEYFSRAVESGIADIVAHPFLNLYNAIGNLDEVVAEMKDDEITRILELAKKNKVAVDINSGLFSENPWWHPEIQVRFYKLCRKVGVKISPASDSHNLECIGSTRLLKPWIEKIGLDDDDFIDYDWIMTNRHRGKK